MGKVSIFSAKQARGNSSALSRVDVDEQDAYVVSQALKSKGHRIIDISPKSDGQSRRTRR